VSSFAANDDKERVREAIDIVDLIGSYIEVQSKGHSYVALCPWHDDTRPSLQVNQQRQSWKCFVCDLGGDIFSFVMQREGIGFRESLEMLAERAGVTLSNDSQRPKAAPGSPDDKQTLFQAMAWAQEQYCRCLTNSPEAQAARDYLSGRGVTADSIRRFRLGFAPEKWEWLRDRARTSPFSGAVLEVTGLLGRGSNSGKLYERFMGRVLFPIHDLQGRAIAYGGRILPAFAKEDSAKYINSPETRLFSKSEQLYGLDLARDSIVKSRNAIVVEGYTDVVMLRQHGIENVVAVLGTALGQRHIKLLRRFADRVTLVLDGDEAGQRRTNEILELFIAEQMDLRILTLPESLDPCDFVDQQGSSVFLDLIDNAVDAVEHRIRAELRGVDINTDTHAANKALEAILATLAKAPRSQFGNASAAHLRQQQLLSRLAREFHLTENALQSRLDSLRRENKPRSHDSGPRDSGPQTSRPPSNLLEEPIYEDAVYEDATYEEEPRSQNISAWEAELMGILSLDASLMSLAMSLVSMEQISSAPGRALYQVFRGLYDQGESPHYDRVMLEIEDPQLKNLLVKIVDDAHAKDNVFQGQGNSSATAHLNLEARLRELPSRNPKSLQEISQTTLEMIAKQDTTSTQEEKEELAKFFEQQRQRQGLSAPTDG